MSTFNFTVRATDDQGAFADRDFSINVKNDKIVKTIVSDGTNVYTSTNPGTDAFITRNGITTATLSQSKTTGPLTYGNGIWVASNSGNYYTSIDGINWTSQVYPIEAAKNAPLTDPTISGSGKVASSYYLISSNIIFNNGLFFLQIAIYNTASVYVTYMFCSQDAVNWSLFTLNNYSNSVATGISSTSYAPGMSSEFVYDGNNIYGFGTSYAQNGSVTYYFYKSSNNSQGVKILNYTPISSTTGTSINCSGLAYINGLWIATTGARQPVNYYTSNDLITWTGRSIPGKYTPMMYSNGVVSTITSVSSINGAIISSTDGITWTTGRAAADVYNKPATTTTPYNGNILTANGNSIYSFDGYTQTALASSIIGSNLIGIATTG